MILAYYFPPLGMGGTQRAAKFVKYLPEFDWRPFVITVKQVAYYATDTSLLKDISGASIFRCGSLDPQRLLAIYRKGGTKRISSTGRNKTYRRLNRLLSWILIPDSKILWLPFAFVKALRLIWREEIDCFITTSPPHSVHLLGKALRWITGKPWIADFRDSWPGGNFQVEPTRIHTWLNLQMEKSVLLQADRLITVSSGQTAELARRDKAEQFSQKLATICNGFDPDDFPTGSIVSGEEFTITYVGTVSDISPVDDFLTALAKFLAEPPVERTGVMVKFVGADLGGLQAAIARNGLNDVVEHVGYLPHDQAVAQIVDSNLLLYCVASRARSAFIPGKTFEYMASGVPVLAISPLVEGIELLKKYTTVCRVNP
ncbi:MAG: glycosyltransferase, partial [bacterium]